MPQKLSQ